MSELKIFTRTGHICSVPGCRRRDCYRISRSEGALHSLYLCRDCIALAYNGAEEDNKTKSADIRRKGELNDK